jgi:hypothetical protein
MSLAKNEESRILRRVPARSRMTGRQSYSRCATEWRPGIAIALQVKFPTSQAPDKPGLYPTFLARIKSTVGWYRFSMGHSCRSLLMVAM